MFHSFQNITDEDFLKEVSLTCFDFPVLLSDHLIVISPSHLLHSGPRTATMTSQRGNEPIKTSNVSIL